MSKKPTPIDTRDVLEIIAENSKCELLTTKAMILRELNLADTKEHRKLLMPVIKQLKEDKKIYTTYGLSEGENGYRGRGYITDFVRTFHVIGEHITFNGTLCEVVEHTSFLGPPPSYKICALCFLHHKGMCCDVACFAEERMDDKRIYFKEIEG